MKDKSVMMQTFRSSTREVFHGADRDVAHGYNTYRAVGNYHTHYNNRFNIEN